MKGHTLRCDHCLLDLPESMAILDVVDGQRKVFCCRSCQAIYRLLRDEGLLEFYEKRGREWIKGPPPDRGPVDPSAFKSFITHRDGLSEVDIMIEGIRCSSCVWLVERFVAKVEGVESIRINYATHRARVRWKGGKTDIGRILDRIRAIGYIPKPFTMRDYVAGLEEVKKDLLMRFGTAVFFSMQLMLYSIALYAGYFEGIERPMKVLLQAIALIVATPVVFYSGMPFLRGAIQGLKTLSPNMDVLIATGALSAYIYSILQIPLGGEVYFDTSAMIVTLILVGRYIEAGARSRASDILAGLVCLAPQEARRLTDKGQTEAVQVDAVRKGEMIEIRPGERVPLDGVVREGDTEVDESMLTGESVPVHKGSGDEVFCGTLNLYGRIIIEVSRTGKETVLSRIIKTVEDIQTSRPPTQALADRVVGLFVPFILLLSLLTGIGWFIFRGITTTAVLNSISVLVIACPCALGLATPLAILAGTARLASKGIMVKDAGLIEVIRKVDTVILDKTGTLTEGRQVVVGIQTHGISEEEVLSIAVSLEAMSEHNIARAILDYAGNIPHRDVEDFRTVPGMGIKGRVEGMDVMIGRKAFIERSHDPSGLLDYGDKQEESGMTVVYITVNREIKALLLISDTPRKEAKTAVNMLRKADIRSMMVTGDNYPAAIKTACLTGIKREDVLAEKTPIEKADIVRRLQEEGGVVMMVGDGINDAPALTQADAGVSMGRATDIALESADAVLMRNDLAMIPELINISSRIYRVIRQNLFWAFLYNAIAIPLAVSGILHPIYSAIAMTVSSLSVVGNSMRLKRA